MLENLRKFGLGYYDFPTMAWNMSVLLRTLTMDIDSRHKKSIPIHYYIIAALFGATYIYVNVISFIWVIFWKSKETGDLGMAVVAGSLLINGWIGTVKLIIVYRYRKTLKTIFDGYLELDTCTVPNSRMSENMSNILKSVKKRAFLFWMMIMFNGFIYIALPVLTPGRHLTADGAVVILGLDPVENSPNYKISCLLLSAATFIACYLPANIALLTIVFVGYTEAQMLALSEELTHLWKDAENYNKDLSEETQRGTHLSTEINKKRIANEYVKRILKVILKRQASNVTLISQVENVFRIPIAAEFFVVTITMITGLLGGIEKTYLQMPFALAQVSMQCLVGQWLIDSSVVFEKAVYDSKWENFDISNRKTVLIMLQMSQRNLTLSAGGIVTLSFRSLMGIYRMIYSTYTALRSTMS